MGRLIDIDDIDMDKILMSIREGIVHEGCEYKICIDIEKYIHSISTAFYKEKVLDKLLEKMQEALSDETWIRSSAFAEAIAIVQKGDVE